MSVQEKSSVHISSDLRVIQMIGLGLLCAFDEFCKKEGLSYSLAGGTLLGAVRHGGFIPWDDDVDIFMLRPDYEKLIELIKVDPFIGEHLEFIGSYQFNTNLTWIRLTDNRTTVQHQTSSSINHVWIDILPVDAVPENEEDRRFIEKRLRFWRRLRLFLSARPFTGKTKLRAVIKTPVVFLLNKLNAKAIVKSKIDKISKAYPYDRACYVAEVVAQGKFLGWMKKDTFKNSTMLEFEGRSFPVMPDYKFYLESRYGQDYMQLPPEENQCGHKMRVEVDWDEYDTESILIDVEK